MSIADMNERPLREGDSVSGICGKQKGTEMRNYPLTAKEQHKRKEKLAKTRQTVMIILMAVAGLYYMTVERGQVTDVAVVTSVNDAPEKTEDVNWIASEKERKFTIEGFLEPTLAADEVSGTEAEKETSVQKQTETQAAAVADATTIQTEDKRVNLNTATLEELDALPGVGPSTAKNIIAYREAHGGFAAPEEIMNVKRIGEKTFDKLKAHITV